MPDEKSTHNGIALSLGGGAARGLAHIGVLKVLEEFNIPVRAISGSSMGALIGGLFAAGVSANELIRIARTIDWIKIIQILFPNQIKISGFLNSKSIHDFVFSIVGDRNIEDLDIPFYACATDIWTGESIILDQGSLARAIEASSCFPFLFTPVKWGEYVLIDGGVSNPLGLNVLRERTSFPVVSVVATPSPQRRRKRIHHKSIARKHRFDRFSDRFPQKYSPFITAKLRTYLSKYQEWTLKRSLARPNLRKQIGQIGNIMEHQLVKLSIQLYQPEVVLYPDISEFNFFDFLDVETIIEKGEKEARRKIDQIISLLPETSRIPRSE